VTVVSENGGSRFANSLRYPLALMPAQILLLLAERRNHGYGLMHCLEELGAPSVSTGSVYRELQKLEEEGLVTSFWEVAETRGPARRVYVITPVGMCALESCAGAAAELSRTLEDLVIRQATLHERRRI
jgi:PadR family transcriptional regulator, regulatory protein PadR